MPNVLVESAFLTAIANAIRSKLGVETTYKPSEMADAIEDISGGTAPTGTKEINITSNGTITEDVTNYASAEITVNVSSGETDLSGAILDGSISGAYSNDTITSLRAQAFAGCTALTSISLPNVTTFGANSLYNCSNVTAVNLPKLKSGGAYAMSGMKKLTSLSLPSASGTLVNFMCSGNTVLSVVDLGSGCMGLGGQSFASCSHLNTVILRRTSDIVSCSNNTFNGTPFASGGTGGTVYVPSALISTYQTASNWSTLYNAGTCTFAALEGSEYE